MTRDEYLFEYLIHAFQTDTSYQPNYSKKLKSAMVAGVKKQPAMTATDLLGLEMRYSAFKFIMQHITKEQPITYLMMNIAADMSAPLLSNMIKFMRVLGAARITGTRNALKLMIK